MKARKSETWKDEILMRRKFAGIFSVVMVLLSIMASSAFALVYNPDNYQRWANVQISSIFSDVGSYDGPFKGNCIMFVRLVLKLDNDAGYSRGWLSSYRWNDNNAHGRELYSYGGASTVTQHRNDYSGTPTASIVETHFSKAHTGDVVQMYWNSSQHTAIINGFEERNGKRGVHFFQANPTIRDNFYTFEELAQKYSTPGRWGGFTIYCFGHKPGGDKPSWITDPTPDISDINPGLRMLTTTTYAKSFTLTSGRYDVYTDSSLSTKYSRNYTGYEEEDWIDGVGKNSSGTVYAKVRIPTDSGGRKTVYVNLKNVFVPGNVNEAGKKAKNKHYGLYKRRNSGKNDNYGIDPGDTVYRLTDDGTWTQILYPTSGNVWRIAWLTKADYNKMMGLGTAPKITTSSLADAYVGENYNAKLSATGTTPITWSCSGTTAGVYGFLLDGKNFVYTSTNGVINGKIVNPISRATPFSVKIKITAKNDYGSNTKEFSITVRDRKPVITTSSLAQATQLRPYSATIKASGATPITWSASGLPRGLSINKSSGKISGTPAEYGTFKNVTVTAKSSKGSGTKTFKLIVNRPPSIKWTLKDAIAESQYSDYVTVNYGTSPFKAAITRGSLPSGISMSVSGSNVYFKGTPKTAGSYSFTLRITDKNGATATKALSITVKKKPLTFIYTFASGTKGKSYSDWVKVTGGTTPITAYVSSGKLPRGTSLSVSGERIYVKGKPTEAGNFTFVIKATSKDGATGSKQFTISVINSLTAKSALPSDTTASMPTQKNVNSGQSSVSLPIPLSVSGDDVIESYEGRDGDIVKVRAGKSVTFMLGYWDETVKTFSVYVDGSVVEGIRISDEGTFTLPAKLVRGDFRVCVKSQNEAETLKSEEIYVIAE